MKCRSGDEMKLIRQLAMGVGGEAGADAPYISGDELDLAHGLDFKIRDDIPFVAGGDFVADLNFLGVGEAREGDGQPGQLAFRIGDEVEQGRGARGRIRGPQLARHERGGGDRCNE